MRLVDSKYSKSSKIIGTKELIMRAIISNCTVLLAASLAATVALTFLATTGHATSTSSGGVLYVANGGANTVEAFTPDGTGSLVASNGLSDPFGLAFDSAGNLYVSSFDGTTVEKVTPAGISSVFATGLSSPSGLAFDNAGNLYVANYGNSTIDKFTPSGVGSVFTSVGLNGPTGMAFDSAGNLYAANWNNNTIEKFDSSGNGSLFAATGLSNPSGLAFDAAGNLYVANYGGTTVTEFTPGGIGSTFASGLDAPSGLAFDSAGNLYVANFGDNIIDEFTPAGVGTVFISNGLNVPLMLAFSAPSLLPQLQSVKSAIAGLKVTTLGDKILLAEANQFLGSATRPANWVNNNQVTLKGGLAVYTGIFYTVIVLETLQYNNRNNATFTAQVQPLISQLVAVARSLAATAIAGNPTSKYAAQANQALQLGDKATIPDAAVLDYAIAWALVAGQSQ